MLLKVSGQNHSRRTATFKAAR